jgi:hypothetical protein
MGSIPSSDSRRPLSGGPSVTQAEPSWSVGSGVSRFLVPVTTSPGRAPCAVDRQIHCGSAPRVSHPLGGFLAYPGFAAFGPSSPRSPTCRCRSGPSPSRFHPQESRVPSGTAGSLVVRVGAALSADPSCPDLPGFLPTPASFRPTLTEAPGLLPCDLVCGRPRRSSRSWSRARATFHQGRNPGLLVTRRHGEPCSPSRRSVDLGAFFLPRARRPSPVLLPARGS